MVQNDEEIKKDVIDQLYWDDRVDASDIAVSVQEGRVRLTGMVGDYRVRQAAYEDTWSIGGVRAVENEVTIATMLPGTNDPGIRDQVLKALQDLAGIRATGLEIIVDNGWVSLEGSFDTMCDLRFLFVSVVCPLRPP